MTLGTKYCKKCDTVKPISDFGKRGDRRSGILSKCRACVAEADRLRKQRNRQKNSDGFDPYANPEPKHCYNCSQNKPRTEFYRLVTTQDGLQAKCKECSNRYDSQRSNLPSVTDKECSNCGILKPADNFYPAPRNSDGLFAMCTECCSEHGREYRQANPEKIVQKGQTRRTKERGQFVETIDLLVLRETDGTACCYCGIELTFIKRSRSEYIPTNAEHEHIVAVDLGGLNSYENSTLICARCNRSKQHKTVLEFIAYREARGLPIKLNAHVASYLHELTSGKGTHDVLEIQGS